MLSFLLLLFRLRSINSKCNTFWNDFFFLLQLLMKWKCMKKRRKKEHKPHTLNIETEQQKTKRKSKIKKKKNWIKLKVQQSKNAAFYGFFFSSLLLHISARDRDPLMSLTWLIRMVNFDWFDEMQSTTEKLIRRQTSLLRPANFIIALTTCKKSPRRCFYVVFFFFHRAWNIAFTHLRWCRRSCRFLWRFALCLELKIRRV